MKGLLLGNWETYCLYEVNFAKYSLFHLLVKWKHLVWEGENVIHSWLIIKSMKAPLLGNWEIWIPRIN